MPLRVVHAPNGIAPRHSIRMSLLPCGAEALTLQGALTWSGRTCAPDR